MATLFSSIPSGYMKSYGKASLKSSNDIRSDGIFFLIAKGNRIEGIEARY